MKQEQLKKEGIKVGDYYVVRRGKRIAVMSPAVEEEWELGEYYPTSTEVAFTEKQALHLLGAAERLRKQEKEKDAARNEIARLESRICELESAIEEEVVESFESYDIELARDGINFGCTNVTEANLKAIKELLDKGGK